jgi:ATP-dependent exoDNAse (exonuclease V) alpha subunit
MDLKFTDEHKLAERYFDERKNIFITGQAGTGKTTLINHLLKKRKHILICATTGVASLLYENGATIHSALKIPINFPSKEELTKYYASLRSKKSRFNPKYAWIYNVEKIDTILIEEISMCSAYLLECIEIALKTLRNNTKPLGGVQFVGVGDFLQLEPVYDTKQVFFDRKTKTQRGPPTTQGEMAFTSETWHMLNIHTVFLTQIFRQKDIQFQSLLYKIRMNHPLEQSEKAMIMSRNNIPKPEMSDACIFIMHERKQVRDFNIKQQSLLGDDVKSVTYNFPHAMSCNADEDEYTNLLKQTRDALQLNYDQTTYTFKTGDKIMIIRNNEYSNLENSDQITKLVNGDIGFITGFTSSDYPIVKIIRNNCLYAEVTISPVEYKRTRIEHDEEVILASISIVPIILAWAITVHKCQGITIHDLPVVINCKNLNWVPNAFYVAFTRAVSIDQVFLENYNGYKQSKMGIQFYNQSHSHKRKHDKIEN